MRFSAFNVHGKTLVKGDKVTDFRGMEWTFQSVTHPSKVFVTYMNDPEGPETYPNRESREFYASVLNLGIWDNDDQWWSFTPEWLNK